MANKKAASAAPAAKPAKAVAAKKVKAPKEAKAPKEPKARKESSFLVASLPLLGLLLAALVALQVTAYRMVRGAEDQRRQEMAQVIRQHHVAMLASYLRRHEDMVKALPDADLLAYLQPGVDAGPDLVKRFPGAAVARVSALNVDPSAPGGLGFAQQDMVLRLAAGTAVHPEVSFMDDGQVKARVVTFSRLLKDAAGQPAGALLLSFPFAPVEAALKDFAPEAGALELVQVVGGEKASLLKTGDDSLVPAADAEGATANPGWKLHFTPGPQLGGTAQVAQLLLFLSILVPLLAVAAAAGIVFRLQRRTSDDLAVIDSYCENLFRYGARQRPGLNFTVSGRLLAALDRYGSELRGGRAPAAPADSLANLPGSDDEGLFGKAAQPNRPASAPPARAGVVPPPPAATALRAEIFRAYDIRGVVGEGLNADVARALGQAIGSEAAARGEQSVVVGRDGRLSGPELAAALIEGLRAAGCNVIDVGMVPTPVLYFAAKTIGTGSGVMVTGSHNPAEYNGFKIMLAGDTLADAAIQALRTRIEKSDFSSGSGTLAQASVAQDYVDRVSLDIALARPLTVVVDAGNGAAGPIAVRTLEALGCNVIPLFCEVDGNFPNHHPDPSKPENVADLMASVASNNADIGIAFDGDGDRIGVVTAQGKMIYPDRLMMLYAKHVLITNPGADIIFDVKCTRDLRALITHGGGRPLMCKTGHSFIKAKLKETGAVLAGEMSGHIFFNDRWFGFDDAVYSAARLLEILALEADDADAVFAEFPENPSTPEINIPVADDKKFALMEKLVGMARFPDGNIITIDGLRVEFGQGWGLVRASNTTPCLVARFEGKTPAAVADIQGKFRALLASADPALQIPF
ncbi:MAG: phosphomannomutase/phosphoglucomutase [Pseudomonadota bacterium]